MNRVPVEFTIGADIEVFGKIPNGEYVALCGKIGGTKAQPKQIRDYPPGCMIQEDNVAMEYNIPPSNHRENFVEYVAMMRNYCRAKLTGLNLELSETSSVSFPVHQLVHPQALEFGCEPDYNAWTKTMNERPTCEDETLRTCGGHIHVGTHDVDMVIGVRAMDLFLGVPSVLVDTSPESSRRRKLYGKAGAMRPKPYGFEYRVLSNFWMFKDELTKWVFDNTRTALEYHKVVNNHKLGERIQYCINSDNKQVANELIKEFNIPLPGDNWEQGGRI